MPPSDAPGVPVAAPPSFPPSIVGVPTAVPLFVGYTARAEIDGRPVLFQPVAVGSLAEFEAVFGGAFAPVHDVADGSEARHDFRVWDPTADPPRFRYFRVVPRHAFNLYDSLRLFYANGGGNCFVVSVGPYRTAATGTVASVETQPLLDGLAAAREQAGPTMLVVPDAVLLPPADPRRPWVSPGFAEVARAMLRQCGETRDRVAILDVYGTPCLDAPAEADTLAAQFRADVGDEGLSYGAAYFPFLQSTLPPSTRADFTAFGDTEALARILGWENRNLHGDPADPANARAREVQAGIDRISTQDGSTPEEIGALNDALAAALPLLAEMERLVAERDGVLPPGAAVAGVMAYVDDASGVWTAPAGVPLSGVARATFLLTGEQQAALSLPADGKAVDAIRDFPGRGTMVWGARTLDGNSNDYRYIQARRTVIYIEQSIKNALNQFVFAPNDGATWVTVVSMVSGFLQGVWARGGLMGATAADAFTVQCGVGGTMTPQDVLDGWMIVQVTLQIIRPAEFVELTIRQRMEGAA